MTVSHDYGLVMCQSGTATTPAGALEFGLDTSTLDKIAYANQHMIDGPRYGYVMIAGTRTYVDLRAYAAQNGQDALDAAVRAVENWNLPASGGGSDGGSGGGNAMPPMAPEPQEEQVLPGVGNCRHRQGALGSKPNQPAPPVWQISALTRHGPAGIVVLFQGPVTQSGRKSAKPPLGDASIACRAMKGRARRFISVARAA